MNSRAHFDLSTLVDSTTFPKRDFMSGLSHARWKPSTFYQDFHHNLPKLYRDPDASRIRNHLDTGKPITEWHVSLTSTVESFSWASTDLYPWAPTNEAESFGGTLAWFQESGLFEFLGRVTVFISQAPREETHVDWETGSVASNYRTKPVEFMWFGLGGKRMEVSGEDAGELCWFDNRVPHRSISSLDLSFSIRADGKFTDRARHAIFG